LPVIAAEPKPVVLTPIYAKRWSWLNGARLHPALGDGAAANIGAGCVNESRVAVTIGTTAAMRMVIPDYLPPSTMPSPALWCYRVDATNTLWGGATSEGGNVHAWLLRNLALDREKLEHNLSAMPPDSHGLTVLPLFVGERSPGFADHARATLDGVSLGTTPVQIARACLEAVAYRLTLIYRAIELFATTRRQNEIAIFANGGALQASPTWAQIIADSTGRPICMCDEPEPTARGVALWLARTNGLQDLPPPILGTVFEPNAHHHAIYQTAIARQIELYEKLI
jgi:gluconokinase